MTDVDPRSIYLHYPRMSGYTVKVYVVQKANAEGELVGEVLAVKLTHASARAVAKRHAPAKVTYVLADKDDEANGPGTPAYHRNCN